MAALRAEVGRPRRLDPAVRQRAVRADPVGCRPGDDHASGNRLTALEPHFSESGSIRSPHVLDHRVEVRLTGDGERNTIRGMPIDGASTSATMREPSKRAHLRRVHERRLVPAARPPRGQGLDQLLVTEPVTELGRDRGAERHDREPQPRVLLAPLLHRMLERGLARAVRTQVAARFLDRFRRHDDGDRPGARRPTSAAIVRFTPITFVSIAERQSSSEVSANRRNGAAPEANTRTSISSSLADTRVAKVVRDASSRRSRGSATTPGAVPRPRRGGRVDGRPPPRQPPRSP